MIILNSLVCLLMLMFALFQYNDPDPELWITIYAVPALWAGLTAAVPTFTRRKGARLLLGLCIALALVGVGFYWPDVPGFWKPAIWWHGDLAMTTSQAELAREGMGMMITLVALVITYLSHSRR